MKSSNIYDRIERTKLLKHQIDKTKKNLIYIRYKNEFFNIMKLIDCTNCTLIT